MKRKMIGLYLAAKTKIDRLLKDESGEASIIAIILVIIAVIGLAAIFKEQMEGIVNGLFQKIKDLIG